MIICIDAGHTPNVDPGACANGLKEVSLTGDICDRIITKLAAYDADVRLVPRTDSLQARCDYANSIGADCFISVHINAGGGTGFESYIHPSAGERTKQIQASLHEACMACNRQYGVPDRGQKTAQFTVLAKTNMPTVLLELCFIDHPHDSTLLKSELYLNDIANEIAWGIVEFCGLKLREPDSLEVAIGRLQQAGIIASPDYWLENARPGKVCKGEFVGMLIQNFAKRVSW